MTPGMMATRPLTQPHPRGIGGGGEAMVEAVEEEVSQEGRRGRPSEIRTPSIGGDGGGVGGGGG